MFELTSIIESIGLLGIAVVIFAESGLFLGAFLPGDSLLFTAGFLASQHILDIRILVPLCFVAAVVGDSFGYTFGRHVGPRLFKREDSLLFHRDHLVRAQHFYEKHGGKTIILARFMPIIRTFAPILAGVGKMHYPRFLVFNITGAFLWAVGVTLLGYWLGSSIPGVDRYLLPIIALIILTSLLPSFIHIIRDPDYRGRLISSFKKLISNARQKREKMPLLKITLPQDYRNTEVGALNHVIPMQRYEPRAGEQLRARFKGENWFRADVPLWQKTTYRLGGPADFFFTPQTLGATGEIIVACRELSIPLYVLGGGSNVLFSDKGWRGVILQPSNTTLNISSVARQEETLYNPPPPLPRGESAKVPSSGGVAAKRAGWVTRWEAVDGARPTPPEKPEIPHGIPTAEVRVGAGVSLQQLIITTHQKKLVGLESFFGIPARVGGAVRNNVHGGPDNFDRCVKEATLINLSTGATEVWQKKKFQFSYDHSILQQSRDWLIWDVTLSLPCADNSLWQRCNTFFASWQRYKSSTQTAAGTAGCVFKNIPPETARAKNIPVSAGALIDSLFGLNAQLRTARISHLHGNFLQNIPPHGGAPEGQGGSSDDIISLINFVREEVKRTYHIALELEIELVGF